MKASSLEPFFVSITEKERKTIYIGSSAKTFQLTNFKDGKSGAVVEVCLNSNECVNLHPGESLLVSSQYINVELAGTSEEGAKASVRAELIISDL